MASYFILGLIEIFMLCFNEIKLRGDGAGRWRWPELKGMVHVALPLRGAGSQVTCLRAQGLAAQVQAAAPEPQPRCTPERPCALAEVTQGQVTWAQVQFCLWASLRPQLPGRSQGLHSSPFRGLAGTCQEDAASDRDFVDPPEPSPHPCNIPLCSPS